MVSSTAPRKSLALPEAATMLTRSGLDLAAGGAAVAAAMAPARTAVPARVWLSESFINGTPEKWNRSKCELSPQWRTGELNPDPAAVHLAMQHSRACANGTRGWSFAMSGQTKAAIRRPSSQHPARSGDREINAPRHVRRTRAHANLPGCRRGRSG